MMGIKTGCQTYNFRTLQVFDSFDLKSSKASCFLMASLFTAQNDVYDDKKVVYKMHAHASKTAYSIHTFSAFGSAGTWRIFRINKRIRSMRSVSSSSLSSHSYKAGFKRVRLDSSDMAVHHSI